MILQHDCNGRQLVDAVREIQEHVFRAVAVEELATLRDQFAMHALGGLVAIYGHQYSSDAMARWAFNLADAMIEQREKAE